MRTLRVALAVSLGLACRAKTPDPPAAEAVPAAAVPVRIAQATVASLDRTVDAPGRTAALVQQKVRAPFAGTLTTLTAIDGDRVHRGQVLGTLMSRDSEAALAGAREMEREAKTPAEQDDARRAVALAERNRIHASLTAPVDGVVLSHAAAGGDRVTEDQEVLTLADTGALVFVADVPQSALSEIRPGLRAAIELAGQTRAAPGLVHDVLPIANEADFTAPVRVDFAGAREPVAVGIFGTVHIVVARKPDAVVVPDAAILRDDVSGKSRIAVVRDGKAHWEEAVTGLRGKEGTELISPVLRPGDAVVVGGQVGLPDGSAVTVAR